MGNQKWKKKYELKGCYVKMKQVYIGSHFYSKWPFVARVLFNVEKNVIFCLWNLKQEWKSRNLKKMINMTGKEK